MGEGTDTLRNIEGLEGTPADDAFVGSDQTNVLDGRNGADILQGLGGADLLQGDAPQDDKPGNDRLDGGAGGIDRLFGAGGDDFLNGGDGGDSFDGGVGIDYCLDGRGKGCEFSGVPGTSSAAVTAYSHSLTSLDGAARSLSSLRSVQPLSPLVPLRATAIGENSELGEATCAGSTAQRSVRRTDSVTVKRRTSAGPPHKAPPPKYTKPQRVDTPFLPDWLGPAQEGNLTWRGTLFRYDIKARVWRPYKRTVTAVGSVDPSGAVVWTTSSGAPLTQVGFAVPKGLFAWKAEMQIPGEEQLRNDWIEPHADYARKGGVFAPASSFTH